MAGEEHLKLVGEERERLEAGEKEHSSWEEERACLEGAGRSKSLVEARSYLVGEEAHERPLMEDKDEETASPKVEGAVRMKGEVPLNHEHVTEARSILAEEAPRIHMWGVNMFGFVPVN